MFLQYSAPASASLTRDLRSDKGMAWMPSSAMWLTHLAINSSARDLSYDLAVDASGMTLPSRPAGLVPVLALGMILSAVWATGLASKGSR
jgi:hypothetical protein